MTTLDKLFGPPFDPGDIVRWRGNLYVVLVGGDPVTCRGGDTRMVGGSPVPTHRLPAAECELVGRFDGSHPRWKTP